MAKYSGKKAVSEETRAEAMVLARGTQVPGQTKAQTRLIAQGIERGIDRYKKQHKEKARARDRQQRAQRRLAEAAPGTAPATAAEPVVSPDESTAAPTPRRGWLPWLLLGLTWAGIGAYWVLDTAGR